MRVTVRFFRVQTFLISLHLPILPGVTWPSKGLIYLDLSCSRIHKSSRFPDYSGDASQSRCTAGWKSSVDLDFLLIPFSKPFCRRRPRNCWTRTLNSIFLARLVAHVRQVTRWTARTPALEHPAQVYFQHRRINVTCLREEFETGDHDVQIEKFSDLSRSMG